MKRLFSAFVLAMLMLSAIGVALAAPKTTASTLRLEETEGGAVFLSDINGKELSVLRGMRLYSGHQVATGAASYAYLSLDDSKAVKLDANSKAQVKKSGKRLEVKLSAGELFFNVTAPLKSDEDFKLRTSTMVTGIRGTSGVISQTVNRAEIYLLTGSAEVVYTDTSGVRRTAAIRAAQKATVETVADLSGPETARMTVRALTEEDVDGFAALEVAADEALQRQIQQETRLSVPLIVTNAAASLEADELADEAESLRVETDASDTTAREAAPLFNVDGTVVIGDGRVATAPGPVLDGDTITLTDAVTAAALRDALERYDNVILDANCAATVEAGQSVTIPADGTLINRGFLIINARNGALHNEGVFYNEGTVNNYSFLYQSYSGALTNTGLINNIGGAMSNTGTLLIGNNGRLNIDANSTFTNSGIVTDSGMMTNHGTVNNHSSYALNNYSALTDTGTINIVSGALNNTGTLLVGNGSRLNIDANSMLSNSGIVTNNGTITNNGGLNNTGTVDNTGGTQIDTGTITVR
ncbi:MAG: FecR domain-containing protein [Syntrophomonadaceae bacterium]|nr:FecR domain-containing protein [Syntrophomonadaceae bacterium]